MAAGQTWRFRGFVADSDEETTDLEDGKTRSSSPGIFEFPDDSSEDENQLWDKNSWQPDTEASETRIQRQCVGSVTGSPRQIEDHGEKNRDDLSVFDIPASQAEGPTKKCTLDQRTGPRILSRSADFSHNGGSQAGESYMSTLDLREQISEGSMDAPLGISKMVAQPNDDVRSISEVVHEACCDDVQQATVSELSSSLSEAESLPDAALLWRHDEHSRQNREQTVRRNLRRRNPIQLHPYAIEGEQYRQVLRARGLRALRFESQAPPLQEAETGIRNSPVRSSSQSDNETAVEELSGMEAHDVLSTLGDDQDEEFPDMDELLRSQSRPMLPSKSRGPIFKMPRGYRANRSRPVPALLSPPSSDESISPATRNANAPLTTTPCLPTPRLSSEGRDAPIEVESSSSDAGSPPVHDQLNNVRRRIRGVLPASWLKIDLQQQNTGKRTLAQRRIRSEEAQRGVARAISKKTSVSVPQLISDDSDETVTSGGIEAPIAETRGEAEEEDHIDAMLPQASRGSGTGRKRSKVQGTLGDFAVRWAPHKERHGFRPKQRGSRPQAKTTRGAKTVPVSLSILDMTSPDTRIPSFLKVARRTAASRRDQGRHVPKSKHMKSTHARDGQEMVESLKAWRRGTLKPRPEPNPRPRAFQQENFNRPSRPAELPLSRRTYQAATKSQPRAVLHKNSRQAEAIPQTRLTPRARPPPRPMIFETLHSIDSMHDPAVALRRHLNQEARPWWLEEDGICQPRRSMKIRKRAPRHISEREIENLPTVIDAPFMPTYTFGVPICPERPNNSFLGSVVKSLATDNLDYPRESYCLNSDGLSAQWGQWTDAVAIEIEVLFQRSASPWEHLIKYVKYGLSFSKPSDRESFVEKMIGFCLQRSEGVSLELLVFLLQLRAIAVQDGVDKLLRRNIEQLTHVLLSQESDHDMEAFAILLDVVQRCPAHFAAWQTVKGGEMIWKILYSYLPGVRLSDDGHCWSLVRHLISPVLAQHRQQRLNSHIRILFSRCLYLISAWRWEHSECIIGTLFDYFAQTSLHHLPGEEIFGSPAFLDDPRLSALYPEARDCCFHLFLKIVASGLRGDEKRVRDQVFRLMPNHGRSFPKEEAVLQESLDALRNHHDLLCTLYRVAPASARPRLAVIRSLVHVASSHREACRIHVQSWSRLLRFQLATHESLDALQPFLHWFGDLLDGFLRQFHLARSEVEHVVQSTREIRRMLDSTIVQNQRQVQAVLCDLLRGLRNGIVYAQTQEAAATLLVPSVTKVYSLFGSSNTQGTVLEAMDVALQYTNRVSVGTEEESQDFGDWDFFASTPRPSPLIPFHEAHWRLLSNCCGADTAPPDDFLEMLVLAWVQQSAMLVKNGTFSWHDFLTDYGRFSWTSLRATVQTRRFAPFFLAHVLQQESVEDHKEMILKAWISSLVEPPPLRYEHLLTMAILNHSPDNNLTQNPPFHSSAQTLSFQISANDFSDRRLTLVSQILANMQTPDADRPLCKCLLQYLMVVMKVNYLEVGTHGAYVPFLQHLIGLLKQYSCPVDPFFTDSHAFPLPAADPTYVVGQLKHYAMRLEQGEGGKEMSIYIHSILERAILDGHTSQLIEQLRSSMDSPRSALRGVFLRDIVPVYALQATRSATGALQAMALLQATERIVQDFPLWSDCDPLLGLVPTLAVLPFRAAERWVRSANLLLLTALLPAVQYGLRTRPAAWSETIKTVQDVIQKQAPQEMPEIDGDLQAFVQANLQQSLDRYWSYNEGRFYFRRNQVSRIIDQPISDPEQDAWSQFQQAFEELFDGDWTCPHEGLGLDNLLI